MSFIERKLRKRLVKDARPLADVVLWVSDEQDLHRRAVAAQHWHTDDEDLCAWLEPFLCVAYATKMVSNFRGDQADAVWQAACGANYHGYGLVPAIGDEEVGGTYAAQAWCRTGQAPFIQTPTTGGAAASRALEAGATTDLMFQSLGRDSSESERRVQAARTRMEITGNDDAGFEPSARAAWEITLAVMVDMEDNDVIPRCSELFFGTTRPT